MAEKNVIFDAIVGSHAYGMNTPESDIDTVGVCVPTIEYFYSSKRFEQSVQHDPDRTIYNITKAIRLIADNNPNMLDLLCVPERCINKITPYWERILDHKDKFISKKCKFTYMGYAFSQLKRIKTHRTYILNPPKCKPERKSFGLPEKSVFPLEQLDAITLIGGDFFEPESKENLAEEIRQIHSQQIIPLLRKHLIYEYIPIAMEFFKKSLKAQIKTINSIGTEYIKPEYKEMAYKEMQYMSAIYNWKNYMSWKQSRNKKRAEMEKKFGLDCKHASHLVRLIRMGKEILETGQLHVDRSQIDGDELIAIRNGEWSYEKIEEYASNMEKEMNDFYSKSTLQKTPDRNFIDELTINVVDDYLRNN